MRKVAPQDVASLGQRVRALRETAKLTRDDVVAFSKTLGGEWAFTKRTLARLELGEGKFAFAHVLRVVQIAARTRGVYVSLDAFFENETLPEGPSRDRQRPSTKWYQDTPDQAQAAAPMQGSAPARAMALRRAA